jgi:hypothetical protein
MALVWRSTCGEIGLLLSVGQRCAATAACLVSSRSTESRLSRAAVAGGEQRIVRLAGLLGQPGA